jgi:DNA-binding FadR family transcriptional regulator
MDGARIRRAAAPQALRLVTATAEKMRDLVLTRDPGTLIGSLPEVARLLDVGVVTVQQAARVLEHEGLLAVRRGPGGGYYGCRPDASALQRSLAAYLQFCKSDDYDALEMMTLLDCDLMPGAARCGNTQLLNELRRLEARVDQCTDSAARLDFEDDLHEILFKMVDRPLIELLAQVSMSFYRSVPIPQIFEGVEGAAEWRQWRHHIIGAILAQDPERARFEAERHRRHLLQRLNRDRPGS